MKTYSKVISLRITSDAQSTLVDLPITYVSDFMHPGVLFKVALLRKRLATLITDVWLHTFVHQCVVSEVPTFSESFGSSFILSYNNLSSEF